MSTCEILLSGSEARKLASELAEELSPLGQTDVRDLKASPRGLEAIAAVVSLVAHGAELLVITPKVIALLKSYLEKKKKSGVLVTGKLKAGGQVIEFTDIRPEVVSAFLSSLQA